MNTYQETTEFLTASETYAECFPSEQDIRAAFVPLGWKFLGSGDYRVCLLSPTGRVFKFAHTAAVEAPALANRTEWEVWQAVRWDSSSKHYFAACLEVSDDYSVLVQEYVPGERFTGTNRALNEFEDALSEALGPFGLVPRDISFSNVISVSKSWAKVVDYAAFISLDFTTC